MKNNKFSQIKYCYACSTELDTDNWKNFTQSRKTKQEYICNSCKNARRKTYQINLRSKVLLAYGGKCVCCGESTKEFLAIDHINNDGAKHRKTNKENAVGVMFYLWIIKNNFPDNLQILCHNCNMAKALYGGCPHKNNINAL